MMKAWMRLKDKLEVAFPLCIALFAATLALNDLCSGKYGSDEVTYSNARNNSYQWYQAKGIKSTIVEGQVELLESLLTSGTIEPGKREVVKALNAQMKARVARYELEKHEILKGSRQLPAEKWVQEINGQLGQVIGGQEYDGFLATLGEAGSRFDLATMLFQICLVLGAIGIVMSGDRLRWVFFNLTLLVGTAGIIYSLLGLRIAGQVESLF